MRQGTMTRLLIVLTVVMLSGCDADWKVKRRQQRNFSALCSKPNLTCIETDGGLGISGAVRSSGWMFSGDAFLVRQICRTKNTGVTCQK